MTIIGHFIRSLTMSAIKPSVLFILGGPGAGKGTICKKIAATYGSVHLSAGDLLREERSKPDSEFGALIDGHIKNGTIVPVEITCSLLNKAMQNSDNPNKKFLIDGFPRNQDNLRGWNLVMSDKVNLVGVLNIECSVETCTQRCLNRGAKGSGRADDNIESLKKRHQTHVQDTLPIIEHYKQLGIVHTFHGEKSPKNVFADVQEVLKNIGW